MFHCPVPLAWKNLTHNRRRLAVALLGIGFAVLLMFMETGFENALYDSAVKLIDDLDADVLVVHRAHYSLLARQTFGKKRLDQIRACPGVQGAYPLYIETRRSEWQLADGPDAPPQYPGYPIRTLAYHLGDPVFRARGIEDYHAELGQPDTALADVKCKAKYHIPGELSQTAATLSGRPIRLVGRFELGTDFANEGNLVMSTENFARYFPDRALGADPLDAVDLAIVQLDEGADVDEVLNYLNGNPDSGRPRALPDDVVAFTKEQFLETETAFWRTATPIGFIFSLGTIIGFVVGVIICYQIIFADVADHVAEFATLKAMGYRNRYFVGFVLQEALLLSLLSFLPGLAISAAFYHVLARQTGLLLVLNFQRIMLVLLLTIFMCVGSGCLAMRKVLSADPAELF